MKANVEIKDNVIKVDGQTNFAVYASFIDLEKLGWVFQFSAKQLDKEGLVCLIEVEDKHTSWTIVQPQNLSLNSDKDWTGNDEKTIDDLITLQAKGDLWDWRPYYD